jgi:hypothetical protein
MCSKEEDKLLDILDKGAHQAQTVAEETLRAMKERVGILRKTGRGSEIKF